MSKPIDYSRFDHIDDSSDEEIIGERVTNAGDHQGHTQLNSALGSSAVQQQPTTPQNLQQEKTPPQKQKQQQQPTAPTACMRKNETTGRYVYEYNGQPIYEWEQSLEEVILYVPAPPVKSASDIHCKILHRRLQLGVKQAIQEKGIFFIDEETASLVDVSESTWTLEDGQIVIYLNKASKGEVWDVALKGKQAVTLDPYAKEQVQKDLMLERFQEENPGMDFRGATFNGNVPDPRTFMGGVKYS